MGSIEIPAGDATRIDLGPQHPSRAGALVVDVETQSERITQARVRIGYEHRGAEKLFEVRDLRAALSLADRHDWQAPIFGELALALSIEAALGITPPPRASWLRTMAAEHSRIHAQLGQLSWLEHRFDSPGAPRSAAARERLRRQFAAWTGNRLHPMLTRIGGVAADVDAPWLAAERETVAECAALAGDLAALAENVPAGLGVVTPELLDGWGLSGPLARAAGLDHDLRRSAPAAAWEALDVPAAGPGDGDARARLRVMAGDARVAADLVIACADRLEGVDGPIEVRLPKIIRLPEGSYYVPVEAPWGEAGIRVVSRGEKTPWRVLLRTPSLANVEAMEALLVGAHADDVEAIVASLGFVAGDVDK